MLNLIKRPIYDSSGLLLYCAFRLLIRTFELGSASQQSILAGREIDVRQEDQ